MSTNNMPAGFPLSYKVAFSFHFESLTTTYRICVSGEIELPFVPLKGLCLDLLGGYTTSEIQEVVWINDEQLFDIWLNDELDWSDDDIAELADEYREAGFRVLELDDHWMKPNRIRTKRVIPEVEDDDE